MNWWPPTIPDEAVRALLALAVWLGALVGAALTAFTLPGIWFMLLVAALVQWYTLGVQNAAMFSWWTLGVCVALSILAEIVEATASALGAGAAALLVEKQLGKQTWAYSGRVGAGAAVGRLAAVLVKLGFAVVVAVILAVASVV